MQNCPTSLDLGANCRMQIRFAYSSFLSSFLTRTSKIEHPSFLSFSPLFSLFSLSFSCSFPLSSLSIWINFTFLFFSLLHFRLRDGNFFQEFDFEFSVIFILAQKPPCTTTSLGQLSFYASTSSHIHPQGSLIPEKFGQN